MINKVCASGIRAAGLLDASIRAGDIEVGVAGGMESMSKAPYLLKEARFGFRMGDGKDPDVKMTLLEALGSYDANERAAAEAYHGALGTR